MNGSTYVLKQVINIGDGDNTVSQVTNLSALQYEAVALAQGQWHVSQFLQDAKAKNAPIYRGTALHFIVLGIHLILGADFDFTSFILLREVKEHKTSSGYVIYELGDAWLAEPRRALTVEKFSGTLNHPQPAVSTIVNKTMYALAHFIYHSTGNDLVYTDLQGDPHVLVQVHAHGRLGTEAVLPNGKDGIILFDPMVQTNDKYAVLLVADHR